MKVKKLAAFLLCLTVTVSTLTGAIYTQAANTAAVLYVSDSGADTADGQTPETPLQSVGKAIELLDKTQSSERTVRVIGIATVSAHLPTHTQAVRIEGNDAAAGLVLTRDIRINGPLSLGSIRLSTGGNPLLCDRNALHIGAGVTVEGTVPGIVSGYQGTWKADLNNNAQKEQVTVDGGSFDIVYLGARATQTSIPYAVVNGVDFTLNGGQVQQAIVGADGWSGNAGYNVYTGDVNITVNGGTVNRLQVIDRSGISDSVRSQVNGHAVQLILNNGTSVATNELNAAAVETLGGVFYQLECATLESSRLETTDTAGTYRVIGDKAAIATDGRHIYTSEGGLLTVPAGSYTVSWSSGEVSKAETVYVSATGSDTADGQTPETAVATMDKAFSLLGAQQAETKTVKIIGSYTLSAHLPIHTQDVSIEGYNADALLILGRNVRLNGATTFDHIRLDAQGITSGGYILCCDRNELTLGANFRMVSDDYGKGLCIDSGYYNAYDASCNRNPQKERITIHNGTAYMVRLGAEYAVTPSVEVNGVDFVLNGGGVYKLYIGAYGDSSRKGYCNYTDNVNITLNGGELKDRLAVSDIDGQSKLNGHAVQLILNNGMTVAKNELSAATVGALGGVYYELRSENTAGCALTATDTAGTYRVAGNKTATAVAVDGSGTFVSENGGLAIGTPGVYTVTYAAAPVGEKVYVSATGSDENPGTAEAPFATLKAAIEALDSAQTDTRTVVLQGAVALPANLPRHTNEITIIGDGNADTVLNISDSCAINGPLKLDQLTVAVLADSKFINTEGGPLTVGTLTTANGSQSLLNMHCGTYNADGGRESVTVNGGSFWNVFIGSYYNNGATHATAGADFVLNGGAVNKIRAFADGWGTLKNAVFTENVNITVNGGSFALLELTNADRPTVYQKAVQVILNNGITGTVPAADSIDAAGGYWLMKCAPGDTLAPTDTAGQFRICGGKTAIATSADGQKTVLSADGVLSVPEAGEYTVTFSDEVFYTNSGTELKFYQDCTLDLSDVQAREESGKLFVGWVDAQGDRVTGTAFTAGTVLYARYVTYADDAFTLAGAQINRSSLKADKQLQFRCTIDAASYGNLTETVGAVTLGIVSIRSEYLGVKELTVDSTYGEHVPLNAAADANTLRGEEDRLVFRAATERIPAETFKTGYTAKGYLQFTDLNGGQRVLYTEYVAQSVYSVAQNIVAKDGVSTTEKQYFRNLVCYADEVYKNQYLSQTKTPLEGAPASYDAFYKLANGLSVREVTIHSGSRDTTPVEIVQMSDFHFNFCNAKDFEENNPSTMSTYYNRDLKRNGASLPMALKCLEYGSMFDQAVITGDVIDYISNGNLELMKRYVWDAHPGILATLGNHDPVRVMGLPTDVPDPTSLKSRYELLQKTWAHDVYYTSKVVKNKVMVIQMDNSQRGFWDLQVAKLQADIATARSRGYTVLLFMHLPLSTGNSADTAVSSFHVNDPSGATFDFYTKGIGYNAGGATGQVYDLITNNADVICGVFTGDMHSDFYTEIVAKTADGTQTTIPQYVLTGAFYDDGAVMHITVD